MSDREILAEAHEMAEMCRAAEERGRRAGIGYAVKRLAALGYHEAAACLVPALAPRDSGPKHKDWCALFGNPEAGKSCDCQPRDSGKEG